MNGFWRTPNFSPVLDPSVIVNLNDSAIETVTASFLGSRYPVGDARLFLDAIVLVAGFRLVKALSVVNIGTRSAGEFHPTDPALALQVTVFTLDVHNAFHVGLPCRRLPAHRLRDISTGKSKSDKRR